MSTIDADRVLDSARDIIERDARAVLSARSVLSDSFISACHALAACEGKLIVVGSGTSGRVAERAAHLFSVGGTPSFFMSPASGLHGALGAVREGDIILALSKGGSSAELNEFCRRARTLGKCLIVVTADPASELAGLADHVLVLTLPDDCDLGGIVATGSSLAAAAVTDAMTEVARAARGYSWDSVLFTHPSGAVGRDSQESLRKLLEAGKTA